MSKALFALGQYAQLLLFLAACWGYGQALLRWPRAALPTRNPLAVALGMGAAICALQALAVLHVLTAAAVLSVVGLGVLLAAWQVWRLRAGRGLLPAPGAARRWLRARTPAERFIAAVIVLCSLPVLVTPLGPPRAWDELMYHLPHAREWALSGSLQVNEWLRYPWFPYNFDLLFAAALTLGNDVLPHLMHASAGWVCAWLIYRLGVQHLQDRATALLAALIWLLLGRGLFSTAYVDLGTALFVLAACAAMQEWHESGASGPAPWPDRRWAFTAAFLIGVAVGIKYQMLALLPLFAGLLAWRDRRPATWLGAVACLCLPCLYWYARNALLTGDPFNPVGGRLFGFTDWNLGDYQAQFEDLRRNAGWPHWTLWPALAVPFVPALRSQRALRQGSLVGAYMLLIWAASSRYPRYLMFAFPLLALLSAAAMMHALRQAGGWWSTRRPGPHRWWRGLGLALLAVLALSSTRLAVKQWKNVAATPAQREAVLQEHIPGYGVLTYLRAHPQARIYQLGLEESLYYAPRPIWGDVFGPWRYRDYMALSPQELHRKLAAQGFTALIIRTDRNLPVLAQGGFGQYFELLQSDGPIQLYRLKATATRSSPSTP